jgi:hypothetical protein
MFVLYPSLELQAYAYDTCQSISVQVALLVLNKKDMRQ